MMRSIYAIFACMPILFMALDQPPAKNAAVQNQIPISATEDLMMEHGMVGRLLLLYQEFARLLSNQEPIPLQAFHDTVYLVHDYIESFHVIMEELYLFPPLEKAGIKKDIIKVLIQEHREAPKLTEYIMAHMSKKDLKDPLIAMIVGRYLDMYVRIFQRHEAVETSEVYPAFRALVPSGECFKMGKLLEEKEEGKFGADSHNMLVGKISELEKQVGIYTLPQF